MKHELKEDLGRIIDLNNKKNSNFSLLISLIRYLITSASFRAMFFYRLSNQKYFKDKKFRVVFSKIGSLGGIYIHPTIKIGGGLLLGNLKCIVLHEKCNYWKNVTILQNVTLGGNLDKIKGSQVSPIVEDKVLIGAGAKILGPVSIGENAMIGANAVVINDIPKNSVAVGVPSKVVKKIERSYLDLDNTETHYLKE